MGLMYNYASAACQYIFRSPLGRNSEFCVVASPATRTASILDTPVKVAAVVNVVRRGLYASLIASIPHRL